MDKVKNCRQKTSESVEEFTQRFKETFTAYSGFSSADLNSESVEQPREQAFFAGLLPRIKNETVIFNPSWEYKKLTGLWPYIVRDM